MDAETQFKCLFLQFCFCDASEAVNTKGFWWAGEIFRYFLGSHSMSVATILWAVLGSIPKAGGKTCLTSSEMPPKLWQCCRTLLQTPLCLMETLPWESLHGIWCWQAGTSWTRTWQISVAYMGEKGHVLNGSRWQMLASTSAASLSSPGVKPISKQPMLCSVCWVAWPWVVPAPWDLMVPRGPYQKASTKEWQDNPEVAAPHEHGPGTMCS